MNYGLFLSAAGALTSIHRQDVIANNLANINTVGFKPDMVFTSQRLPERLESDDAGTDPQLLLERLGGGVFLQPSYTIHDQGQITETGNPLDLAMQGNGFLVVAPENAASPARFLLTRDGRMTLNREGQLVAASDGLRVLDSQNRPVTLATDRPVTIQPDGQVIQDGEVVTTLQLVSVPDTRQLTKVGDNRFKPSAAVINRREPATGRLAQGFVENSAIDPVIALTSMLDASRSAQVNIKMMQYADNILGQTINTFGRVA